MPGKWYRRALDPARRPASTTVEAKSWPRIASRSAGARRRPRRRSSRAERARGRPARTSSRCRRVGGSSRSRAPDWRAVEGDRDELFGAAMAYVESHGRGPASSVRNALLTCGLYSTAASAARRRVAGRAPTRWATLAVVARTAVRASTSCSTPSGCSGPRRSRGGARPRGPPRRDASGCRGRPRSTGHRGRAADDVAVESLAGEEDQREVADAAAGRDLVGVAGGPGHHRSNRLAASSGSGPVRSAKVRHHSDVRPPSPTSQDRCPRTPPACSTRW